MKGDVLKKEKKLEKITEWNRLTYPLKMKPTLIQLCELERMMEEFRKCIHQTCQKIIHELYKNHLLIINKDNIEEGVCPLCNKNKKMDRILKGFDLVVYREFKGKPTRKPVPDHKKEIKVCGSCMLSLPTLRKFFLKSKEKGVPFNEWDMTKFANLGNNNKVYDACLQKAKETVKSYMQIKSNIKNKIDFLRKRIEQNDEELNKEMKRTNYDKDKIRRLNKFIRHDKNQIEKEKKKIAEDIEFGGGVIRLYENSYDLIKDQNDYYISLLNFVKGKKMVLDFFGENYQKKLASKFLEGKKSETEITKKGEDYYLHYIYREEGKVPVPDKTFTPIGVDVNVINLACYLSIDKNDKPRDVRFFSGRDMRARRRRMAEVRKKWAQKLKHKSKGGKGKTIKWYKDKCKKQRERDYIKNIIHNITTTIVREIKEKYDKPVIVMEELKYIRDRITKELKITKKSIEGLSEKQSKGIRADKLLNKDLNNWNFDEFQRMIKYKANYLGIPVVFVSAKDTSIKCNKCGHTEENNYKDFHKVLFKCENCGYECNADFNASVNIGRNFFTELENDKKLVPPQVVI